MEDVLEKKIKKLEEKKKSLDLRKKLLREKERQKQKKIKSKRFLEVGQFAEQSGILNMEDSVILGAFFEIESLSSSEEKMNHWRKTGESILSDKNAPNASPISVTFSDPLSSETRKIMKSIGFRYNKFRDEFYGYEKEETVRKKLEKFNCSIESIEKSKK